MSDAVVYRISRHASTADPGLWIARRLIAARLCAIPAAPGSEATIGCAK